MNTNTIYLDNAATTPIAPSVKEAMTKAMDVFGNPSSTHGYGRESRILIEQTRKKIAKELNCEPGEIFFTSGGTEADNLAIQSSVRDLGVERIITLPTEHHAVVYPAEHLRDRFNVELHFLKVDEFGDINLGELEELLSASSKKTLVSIMHGNNEIGNLIDIQAIGEICKLNNALFHSDTVQTIGHFKIDLSQTKLDFATCSAHKFNGPKGVGFLFARGGVKIHPQIFGGGQERNMRSGTENIIGIAGLGAAFELVCSDREEEQVRLNGFKQELIDGIKKVRPDAMFNGRSADIGKSLYTVLSVALPQDGKNDMLLFQFDMKGIAVSGGSACNSGAQKGSHVIESIRPDVPTQNLRISTGRYTTSAEIQSFLEAFAELTQQ
ncbi:MAG: cysteine desulfurase [Flavobacteriia bacterium]|nr:cysteine desulfurase [Flavobacteriia bacterium]